MDILVPIPKSIKELGGSFIIDKNVIVYYEGYHNKILLERLDLFINQINELTTTSNNFHLFLKNKNKRICFMENKQRRGNNNISHE